MDELLIALRAAVALGAVLGLLWWISRRVQKGQTPGARRAGGTRSARIRALLSSRAPSGTRREPERITVIARSGIGARAQLVVAEFGGIRYVLGVSEHGVSLVDTQEVPEDAEQVPGPVRRGAESEFGTAPDDPASFGEHTVAIFPDRAMSRRQVRLREGYRTPPLSR